MTTEDKAIQIALCSMINQQSAELATLREQVADYEEAAKSRDELVRQLDVILNGEEAAKQASLCDMVSQYGVEIPRLREQVDLLRDALKTCTNLLSDLDNIGGFFGLAVITLAQEVLGKTKPKE